MIFYKLQRALPHSVGFKAIQRFLIANPRNVFEDCRTRIYGSEVIEETKSLSRELEFVSRPVRRRFHPQYSFAKFLAPLDLVLILRDGRWPRRSERTAGAMRGPLVYGRQRTGNWLPTSPSFRNREGV